IFEKYNPNYPFEYEFVDDAYAQKFHLEVTISRLASLFAGLAIFVSCMGLFGLATYMTEQRRKEIGIRKVLGATVAQLWLMLSKEFLFLVFISCLLATPLALYFAQNWLQQYDYRITITPISFVIAGLLAMIITLLTVSLQAIRVGTARPVDSLRSE
ncbi:MAG: FtsX-like permease family protein, partial [Lewinella sp.]|nr:FtsX-like permease family protein [Lewinella sp.]